MSKPVPQQKHSLPAESSSAPHAGPAAPTGVALDSFVDKILGRAARRPPGVTAEAEAARAGLTELDARLPPAALAAQTARLAAKAPPPLHAATPPGAAESEALGIDSLIDLEAGWLPADPERRDVFIQVFRFWHARVNPQYATQATPAFLYLVTTLPVLIKARDALQAERLWEPKSETTHALREGHPAWKKYCEFLPRAQQASAEIRAYRTVSLISGLDDLLARVTAAEKMYRQM